MYEEIDFCGHCKERQKERYISHQQKLNVIKQPDGELPARRMHRRKFWKNIDGSKLTVILKEVKNGKKALFITAYWN